MATRVCRSIETTTNVNAFMRYAYEVVDGKHPEQIAANLVALQARVRSYEEQHGMSSLEARTRLGNRTLAETYDITRWMIDYDALRRAEGKE